MLVLLFALCFIDGSLGGTPCPPREDVYPCSCASIPQGKRVHYTILSCHKLPSTDSLNSILPALRSMQIDKFYLYDSFWEANALGTSEGETKQILPTDWITLLKVKELEIVDTTLSSCFACNGRLTCKNSVTTRFTAVNSSSSEKICTLCDLKGTKYSWTGCLTKLKHFEFTHGRLNILRMDFFPVQMRELVTLKLSHNQMEKIEKNALANLVRLKTLDLSHNALSSLSYSIFGDQKSDLQFLDISWNSLKTIDLLSPLPMLKTFNASHNFIENLVKTDWRVPAASLRRIDLRDNPLHCDCSILWVNETFHINTLIEATCASPEEYENSQLRRASILLATRCDEEGNIGTRSTKKKGTTQSLSMRREITPAPSGNHRRRLSEG